LNSFSFISTLKIGGKLYFPEECKLGTIVKNGVNPLDRNVHLKPIKLQDPNLKS
jgi:hypothetical protein